MTEWSGGQGSRSDRAAAWPRRPRNAPSLREWVQGALFPLHPEPSAARVGFQGAEPIGRGREATAASKIKRSAQRAGITEAEGRALMGCQAIARRGVAPRGSYSQNKN